MHKTILLLTVLWARILCQEQPVPPPQGTDDPLPFQTELPDYEDAATLEDEDMAEYADEEAAHKIRGDICRRTCDSFAGYATGLCASLSSFGAPLACLIQGLQGIACAVAQGVLWGFGGYCTSSAVYRMCELCGEDGVGITDLYSRQVEINNRLVNVSDLFRAVGRARDELEGWSEQWKGFKEELDFKIRTEAHFEDIDHILQLMSEIEFDKDHPGIPVDNFALREFNRTVLSPGRQGVLNLINQLHRLLSGGGMSLHFGGHKSIFEMDRRFCQAQYVRQLERTLFNLYQVFFFAGKLNGFDEDETSKYRVAFAEKRMRQRVKIAEACRNSSEAGTMLDKGGKQVCQGSAACTPSIL